MKKIVLGSITFLSLLTLAACSTNGKNTSDSSNTTKTTAKKATIKSEATLKAIAKKNQKQFNKDYPDLFTSTITYGQWNYANGEPEMGISDYAKIVPATSLKSYKEEAKKANEQIVAAQVLNWTPITKNAATEAKYEYADLLNLKLYVTKDLTGDKKLVGKTITLPFPAKLLAYSTDAPLRFNEADSSRPKDGQYVLEQHDVEKVPNIGQKIVLSIQKEDTNKYKLRFLEDLFWIKDTKSNEYVLNNPNYASADYDNLFGFTKEINQLMTK